MTEPRCTCPSVFAVGGFLLHHEGCPEKKRWEESLEDYRSRKKTESCTMCDGKQWVGDTPCQQCT